jgi:hypothetical protein
VAFGAARQPIITRITVAQINFDTWLQNVLENSSRSIITLVREDTPSTFWKFGKCFCSRNVESASWASARRELSVHPTPR